MELWEWKVETWALQHERNGWHGEMNLDAQINPEMAASMGLAGSPEGAKLGDIMGECLKD